MSIVEKGLLVKLYYKNSKSDIVSISLHEGYAKQQRTNNVFCIEQNDEEILIYRFLVSRQRSGCPSTAAAVATTVKQMVQSMMAVAAHGKCSTREVSRQTGVPYGSVWRALRIILRRYPYKLLHNQELNPPDFDSCRDFTNLVFNKMEEQQDWFHTALMTDETHFTFSGAVNIHNCKM
ncbi:uncharacterized protein TNIN_254261 [Trichonephila inaurata madagascariensis]|uniref:Transposase n=1 Tax=Trichonephila inaurata madagascariensis TaxID=2747483 RepID=A0A8X7C1J9_9ARAC|nr:uncharacterized protein TNIN_254261 [Trichonephila inaurata madagascariensis]